MIPTLPAELLPFIVEFQPLFSKSVWVNAQTLLTGAILAIGKRTVTACLQVMGKSDDKHFQNYHRVLNRALADASGQSCAVALVDCDFRPDWRFGLRIGRYP
ncbi:MAG: hypothetical protein U0Y68_15420 [Blastocatellia bacterium]